MTLQELITSFPWARYSRKLKQKIDKPQYAGFFTKEEAHNRHLRLVMGEDGTPEDHNAVRLYWLVDKDEGVIVEARFQVYGQSALIGAAEAACEMVIGKNYDQARRISADLLDKHIRDKSDKPAFPPETYPHLNLVLSAIDNAAEQCTDLPLPTSYSAPPAPMEIGEVLEGGIPGWDEKPLKEQIGIVEQILDRDIRPYIALDAGGVNILDLQMGRKLLISYEGTCTSCYSSIGTTLSYIQQVLRAKVHPDLEVVPDLERMKF